MNIGTRWSIVILLLINLLPYMRSLDLLFPRYVLDVLFAILFQRQIVPVNCHMIF